MSNGVQLQVKIFKEQHYFARAQDIWKILHNCIVSNTNTIQYIIGVAGITFQEKFAHEKRECCIAHDRYQVH